MDITQELNRRILILDGAMGSMIQSYHLKESDFRHPQLLPSEDFPPQTGNNDVLCLTRPDVIADIHRQYLEAGADIITTNTFSAQRISLADYGCEHLASEINRAAIRIAREEAARMTAKTPERPRFVAASIGPTNKTASLSPDIEDPAKRAIDFDTLHAAYSEQIIAVTEAGADLLLLETIFDTLNAKAALHAAEDAFRKTGRRIPIMVSLTLNDRGGHTLSGQTLLAFATSVRHAPLLSIGINCSFGAAEMLPFLRELAADSQCCISCHPNAGLPNGLGLYDQSPAEMAEQLKPYVEERLVNIVGGCCGTTPEHIAALTDMVGQHQPRIAKQLRTTAPRLELSGMECLTLTPEMRFINVGERCNVAGSRKFLRLINEKKYDEACAIARKQVEDGALVIDINLDDGLLETEQEMEHFLRLLGTDPQVARVPFMIDSSKWHVIRTALKNCQGKCIVNSISLKGGEEEFLQHVREIREYGAAVVVMAFDEEGQATTFERRTAICQRAYRLMTEVAGFPPEDIIFDPNVLAICTGFAEHRSYALDFIRTAAWIKEHLPGAHISGGVSNLSFSFRGNNFLRDAMHAVFLCHAIQNGMDMGIVNPSSKITYADIPSELLQLLEAVILHPSEEAEEALIGYAAAMTDEAKNQPAKAGQDAWREASLEERLAYALIRGIDEALETDLNEALATYPTPVSIIEQPLMQAMETVGQLFGEGKMMLPQVVKTARTMKKAVAYLQPYIEQSRTASTTAAHNARGEGIFIMATVKGDVHDIGKNIVSVVLGCNKFRTIDLGVMVPPEKIVEAAIRHDADYVGLSGLITPSLDEMVHTVRAMQAAGLTMPVLLGGATTSALHTALKIAPEYDGPVLWVKDASQMVIVASHLKPLVAQLRMAAEQQLGRQERLAIIAQDSYVAECRQHYAELRNSYQQREAEPHRNLEEDRKNKLQLF